MYGVKRCHRPFGSSAPSRTAAIGGTRVARIAGNSPASTVISVPTRSETTIVRGAKTVSASGRSRLERAEQRLEALREPEPEEEPDDGREEADHERLEQHRAEHLPPGGAERPQRRELARPLGDRDRERVEDHERADEQRDPGEGEQEVADERRELADLVLRLLRLLGARLHLRVGGEERLDVGDQLLGRDAVLAGDGDRVELALAVEERLRGRDVEDRERRRAERLDVAVLGDPDDLEVLLRLQRRDLDRLADREVLAVGGAGVDDDLPGAVGPAALEQVQRVEDGVLGRRVDPEPEARRAVRVDRLAVVPDDLRVRLVVDAAHRELDRVEAADLVEQRRVDAVGPRACRRRC